ncbi:MAG: response regulator [Acidobacteria bacterium]|nr:response regulator [Acidobacteriota bacterium]MBI3422977.1 response regulator [Acidobacteriota bacterium]
MKVMVVDDEADVRLLFEQRFRREVRAGQIAFYFALSAEEALALLEQVVGDVSLILSDINMPGMNGLDLLKAIKAKHQHLRVFMITAYGSAEYQQRAVAYGCDDYFTKPLDFGMLRAKMLA